MVQTTLDTHFQKDLQMRDEQAGNRQGEEYTMVVENGLGLNNRERPTPEQVFEAADVLLRYIADIDEPWARKMEQSLHELRRRILVKEILHLGSFDLLTIVLYNS